MTTVSNRKIISRSEAKESGLVAYFTGEPCVRGHVDARQTTNGVCLECRKENARKSQGAVANEKRRAYRQANPEKVSDWARRDREKNGDARNEYTRAWHAANPEQGAQRAAKRRSRIRTALPSVRSDLEPALRSETLAFYAEARMLTELTGVPHEVDHIFPISKGGLHAPWNFRILLMPQNRSKKDKWPKDEPTHVMWQGELMCRLREDTDQ